MESMKFKNSKQHHELISFTGKTKKETPKQQQIKIKSKSNKVFINKNRLRFLKLLYLFKLNFGFSYFFLYNKFQELARSTLVRVYT